MNKSNKLHVSFIDIFWRFCQYALKASLKAFDIDMFLDRHVYKYVCHVCIRTSFVSMTINQCIQRHWQIHAFCYFWYAYHPVFDHHCSIENKENRLKIWICAAIRNNTIVKLYLFWILLSCMSFNSFSSFFFKFTS